MKKPIPVSSLRTPTTEWGYSLVYRGADRVPSSMSAGAQYKTLYADMQRNMTFYLEQGKQITELIVYVLCPTCNGKGAVRIRKNNPYAHKPCTACPSSTGYHFLLYCIDEGQRHFLEPHAHIYNHTGPITLDIVKALHTFIEK